MASFRAMAVCVLALLSMSSLALAQVNPAALSATAGPALNTPRSGHWMITDPSGVIAVVGGTTSDGAPTKTAEVLANGATSFVQHALHTGAMNSACARLADGRYAIFGGTDTASMAAALKTADIFDPTTRTFTQTSNDMLHARANATAATLADGRVLIAGSSTSPDSAIHLEVFDPVTQTFTDGGTVQAMRSVPVILPTADGRAVILGGFAPQFGPVPEMVEIWDSATNTTSIVANSLFAGETGWVTALSPSLGWGSQPSAFSKLPNGNYLLLATKNVGIFTYNTLFTFNPSTLAITRLTTTPALPERNPVDFRYNTTVLPHPMIDAATGSAYLIGERFDSLYQGYYAYSGTSGSASSLCFYVLNLNDNTLRVSTPRSLPANSYVGLAAKGMTNSGVFFVTGGGAYGYGSYAGGRPYGGYGYQHYGSYKPYATVNTAFVTPDWSLFKGIAGALKLLMQ